MSQGALRLEHCPTTSKTNSVDLFLTMTVCTLAPLLREGLKILLYHIIKEMIQGLENTGEEKGQLCIWSRRLK